ncbi:MAG: energy transducer TonB [Candidatus Devosia phytovorans]|uniref:Protein TonB n=1 Tax=Candidatus Devosia phytovorans TaxID=3121372 RepID=A0AAJ5VXV6_9HYPH|nr:energy transducer TonB [Devosia sp.]WEK06031.1 MAG: energy transducer TonB [Devosia sp.]
MPPVKRLAETVGSDAVRRFGIGDVVLWAFSLALVCSVQATALYIATTQSQPTEVTGAPPPAIMIELAEMAMAPQVEDIAVDDGELSLPPESAASEPSPAQDLPDETEPPPEVETLPEPEPLPEPEAVEEPEPLPEQEPEPSEMEEVEEPPPEVAPAETAEVAIPMPVSLPAEITEARRQFAQQQQREREERERAQQAAQQAAASQQTAPRSVQAEQSPQMAAPQQTTTTQRTPTISPQQWQSQVLGMIERAKRYPQDAQRRREEGTIRVKFVIDRSGTVLSASILQSSGHAALDEAARELINRLPKLPPPPATITANPISLEVAVNFNLR